MSAPAADPGQTAGTLTRNVFVFGLDEFQQRELQTVTNAGGLAFHPLLDKAALLAPEGRRFADLLDEARRELDAFDGTVDALIAHWDFPTSVLAPMLARERGLPAQPLRSVLICEHKYWSRLAQREIVPEVVPGFAGFDPFDEDPLASIDLEFPFWVKPVKSYSSQLGFKVTSPEDFADALEHLRAGVHQLGDVFDEAVRLVDLPPEIARMGGTACIAEQLVSGRQLAPEGAVHGGHVYVHGVFDMPKDERGLQWSRLVYPARAPEQVQRRMVDVSERLLRHIGYDDGCFNVEFMWDEEADQLWLVEVNTRISQAHSDLFAKVDGMSNHEVALDVALGVTPAMPDRRGPFGVAAKAIIHTDEIDDGIVTRVPTETEIAELTDRFPETHVQIAVAPGDRLSELSEQSAYRYDVGTLYLGARDWADLDEIHRECLEHLRFEFEPIDP
jgi:hypothetical protein